MFAGFNREVRNSLRLMGLRIRYAVAVVEIAAEQYGAVVANNIDLLLQPRGTGAVRIANNLRHGGSTAASSVTMDFNTATNTYTWTFPSGRTMFLDNNCNLQFGNIGSGIFAPNVIATGVIQGNLFCAYGGYNLQPTFVGSSSTNPTYGSSLKLSGKDHAAAGGFALAGVVMPTDTAVGVSTITGGAALSSATTNIAGGAVTIAGGAGASGSSGAANGGHVYLLGGQGYGTGTRGQVRLGYDGVSIGRVTVRNTILSLNGYTSSAADPTTTDLPVAGDYGVHKNTTSGTVYLAFNDAGTIKKVALA